MIVITIEGGVIQGVASDDPSELGKKITVINYDEEESEGADPENVIQVPQGDGVTAEAVLQEHEVGVLYEPVAEWLKTRKLP